MERLLGVRWEAEREPGVGGEGLRVPAGLIERLQACARGYRVTELKEGLRELEGLGPDGGRLAERLRRLAQESRMAQVIEGLEAVERPEKEEG